jgi:hypothetical protein
MTVTTTPTTAAKDGFLRFAMRLDAAITGVLGAVFGAVAPQMSSVTGLSTTTEYALSAFFVVYGVSVFALSLLPSVRRAGVLAVGGNVLYTVLAVGVVLADVWPLTTLDIVLVLGSGVYTLVMADLQYLGLKRLNR